MTASSYYPAYMWRSRRLLPVALLKEHQWCPMIPWLVVNAAAAPPETPSMRSGRHAHHEGLAEEVARRLGYQRPRYNVALESRELGLYGTVDILSPEDHELVEAKQHLARPQHHHLAQLKAYTALALYNTIPIDRAHLATPRGIAATIKATSHVIRDTEALAQRLHETVENPDPPPVTQPPAKCRYCRYRRICPYAATKTLP